MATTITHAEGTVEPRLIEGWDVVSTANTIVHTILNREDPDITLRSPSLRSGTFSCLFLTEADAVAAFAVFRTPQVLAMSNPNVPAVDMSFIVAGGEIAIRQDAQQLQRWHVEVPFVEVSP